MSPELAPVTLLRADLGHVKCPMDSFSCVVWDNLCIEDRTRVILRFVQLFPGALFFGCVMFWSFGANSAHVCWQYYVQSNKCGIYKKLTNKFCLRHKALLISNIRQMIQLKITRSLVARCAKTHFQTVSPSIQGACVTFYIRPSNEQPCPQFIIYLNL